MDRETLQTMLSAGPARKLDLLSVTLELDPDMQSKEPLFFHTPYLNRGIVFKVAEMDTGRGNVSDGVRPIRTLLFFPYDFRKPEDGGESMTYDPRAMHRMHTARTNKRDDLGETLKRDIQLLDILDDTPSLSPFLLHDAFMRANVKIPPAYLQFNEAHAERLRERLRGRVRPLIHAAVGGGENMSEQIELMMEAFLKPDESSTTADLAKALQIETHEAPDVLRSWAGIAFFEDELIRLQPSIKAFASWLANNSSPREYLLPTERQQLEMSRNRIKTDLRQAWRLLRETLRDYQDAYVSLVFDSDPLPFVNYLRHCRHTYWQVGDVVGRFEQAIFAWERYMRVYGNESLPFAVLRKFFRFMDCNRVTVKNESPTQDAMQALGIAI